MNIKVRLDRGLANASFLELYNDIKVWHVQTVESDHCCLVVECNNRNRQAWRRKKHFRYENMWRRDPSYIDVIQNSWDTTGGAVSLDHVMSQLGRVQMSLQELEGNTFGSVRKTLAVLRKELEQVRSESGRTGPSRRERQIMTRISELLSREEIMEKQRSRIDWL